MGGTSKPNNNLMINSTEFGYEMRSATELADNDVKVFEEIKMVQEEDDIKEEEEDSVLLEADGTGKVSQVSN